MSTRHHARTTTVSWIPSEAVTGSSKAIFATVAHYDEPPADVIDGDGTGQQTATLDAWRVADRFRFANQLAAWIEVDEHGAIVNAGYDSTCLIGSTTLAAGRKGITFEAVPLPVLQAPPEHGDGYVRFVQSFGGRTGVPGPRRVNRPPFVQFWAPLVWTTLALTIYDDGTSEHEFVGCSPFPRHWLYDTEGVLAAKSGTTNFKNWYRRVLPKFTPWGDVESPALVAAVESAAERALAIRIMRDGTSPRIVTVKEGTAIVRQGEPGDQVALLLDGLARVDVDGEPVTEVGPGAIIGERAVVEGGVRTATITAITPCRLAVADAADIDITALHAVAAGHRREHATP